MGKSFKVAKQFSTGGLPGIESTGSVFEQANVTLANKSKGHGGVEGSASYPAGKGAIGNESGIPEGARMTPSVG